MKFCTTCQRDREEAGGYKKPGSNRAWRCKSCYERKTTSIYRANRPTDPKFLGEVKKILGM